MFSITNLSKTGSLAVAIALVAFVAVGAAAVSVTFVDQSDVGPTDEYNVTFDVAENGTIDAVNLTDVSFNSSATDGTEDVTVQVEDSNGSVVAEETHTALSDSETHNLSTSVDVTADADETYSVLISTSEVEFEVEQVTVTGEEPEGSNGGLIDGESVNTLVIVALALVALLILRD